MNKAQLVEAIADKMGGRQQAADAVDAVLDAIVRAVVGGDRVSVTGFGSFGTGSGTATAGGAISDYEGPVSRGREIWLKVTLRPSEF